MTFEVIHEWKNTMRRYYDENPKNIPWYIGCVMWICILAFLLGESDKYDGIDLSEPDSIRLEKIQKQVDRVNRAKKIRNIKVVKAKPDCRQCKM